MDTTSLSKSVHSRSKTYKDELQIDRIPSCSTRRRKSRNKDDTSIKGLHKSLSIRELKPLVDLSLMDDQSNYQPSFTKGSLLDQIIELKRTKSVIDIKSIDRNKLNRKHSCVMKKGADSTSGIMVSNEDEIPLFDLVMMRSKSTYRI